MLAGFEAEVEWSYSRSGRRVRVCADDIDDLQNHLLNAKQLWLGYTSAVDIEAC
jgi:hypothetical protein